MNTLRPPIDIIAENLFGPSPDLIARWVKGEPSVSAAMRDALQKDASAREMRVLLDEPMPPTEQVNETESIEIPTRLQDLFERKAAASHAKFSPTPRAGQIVRIDQVLGPGGALEWDLPQSLAVLLSEPTEVPEVWYGWMVSRETDYACKWDFVLEECDGPRDPLAGMVQMWNPIHVYLPSTTRVLAELSSERLRALHALAAEFLLETGQGEADPGALIERETLGGFRVRTGTALGDESQDDRVVYQRLYFSVAQAVKEPARLAMRASVSWLERISNVLAHWADEVGLSWSPTPAVANAMKLESEPPDFILDNRLRFSLLGREADVAEVHVRLESASPLRICRVSDGPVKQCRDLTVAEPTADFRFAADQPCLLDVYDQGGHLLYSLPIGALPAEES